jgi:nitrite reductase/ring-hydroxylating ferredoxin subunit
VAQDGSCASGVDDARLFILVHAVARIQLCSIDDVAPGGTLKVETAGLTLAVYNVDGSFYVTDDHCTHGPGSLSEGFLDGEIIECNFHQGCFNVRTGEVVAPPCTVPIKTYKTVVEEGTLYVEV